MKKPVRSVWAIFAVLCAVVAIAIVVKALQPQEIIPWRNDFVAATEESHRVGKPVFAYFTAIWCGPCQSMKHTTWAHPIVEEALRGYVPVKIDLDHNPDLAEKYNVRAVPAFAVLGDDGKALKQTDGALSPEEMVTWIKEGK